MRRYTIIALVIGIILVSLFGVLYMRRDDPNRLVFRRYGFSMEKLPNLYCIPNNPPSGKSWYTLCTSNSRQANHTVVAWRLSTVKKADVQLGFGGDMLRAKGETVSWHMNCKQDSTFVDDNHMNGSLVDCVWTHPDETGSTTPIYATFYYFDPSPFSKVDGVLIVSDFGKGIGAEATKSKALQIIQSIKKIELFSTENSTSHLIDHAYAGGGGGGGGGGDSGTTSDSCPPSTDSSDSGTCAAPSSSGDSGSSPGGGDTVESGYQGGYQGGYTVESGYQGGYQGGYQSGYQTYETYQSYESYPSYPTYNGQASTIGFFTITPRSVERGGLINISWSIYHPNTSCKIVAEVQKPASCDTSCQTARNAAASTLNTQLSTGTTNSNDPNGGNRNMNTALNQANTSGYAKGTKSVKLDYSTTFTLSCGTSSTPFKSIIYVTDRTEG